MASIILWLDRFRFPVTIVLVAAILGGSGILVVRSLELRDVIAARTPAVSADQLTLEELQRQQAELVAELTKLKTEIPRADVSPSAQESSQSNGTVAGERSASADVQPLSQPSTGQLVHLNSANQGILETLPGIGASKAQAIIDYRSAHGPFQSIDELDHVKGIGATTLAKLRPYLTLD